MAILQQQFKQKGASGHTFLHLMSIPSLCFCPIELFEQFLLYIVNGATRGRHDVE